MTHARPAEPARTPPWTPVAESLDDLGVTEASVAAKYGGLDLEVEARPVHTEHRGRALRVPGHRAVVDSDTGECLALVGGDYRVRQYRDRFAFLDGLSLRYRAAGTLRGGREGFLVVQPDVGEIDLRLGETEEKVDVYAVLRTSHDRTVTFETSVLAVCRASGCTLALPTLAREVRQRWTLGRTPKPDDAERVMRGVEAYVDHLPELLTQLAELRLDARQVAGVLGRVTSVNGAETSRRASKIQALLRDELRAAGTVSGWTLVCAIGEHMEWGRPFTNRYPASRLLNVVNLDGETHRALDRSTQLLLALYRARAGA